MNRRTALKILAAASLTPKPLFASGTKAQFGWRYDPVSIDRFIRDNRYPFLSQINKDIKGTGKGKKAFLHKALEQVMGKQFVPHDQKLGDCFYAGTPVTMADGSQKPIEKITTGEAVISHTGKARKVTRTIRKPYEGKLITVHTPTSKVTCTPDHLFYTGGWKAAKDLKLSDTLYSKETPTKVTKLREVTPFKTTVYCLEVEEDHSFSANLISVHNCVSHAAGLGVDILSAVEIVVKNQPERWVAKTATEPIYGGSRVEIGNYTSGEGSTGHWAAQWLAQYGVLLRQKYLGWDFSVYNPSVASQFGMKGCPDELEPIAKLHPVEKVAICTNYEDLCDCIYNGYPVMVCSGVGFGQSNWTRDSEGFLTRRGQWWHAMLFAGYDDEYRRPGALCFNSWGDWVKGPTRGPQPRGTFWIDAATVDSMLKQSDSFAFSDFVGFPSRVIPPYILY